MIERTEVWVCDNCKRRQQSGVNVQELGGWDKVIYWVTVSRYDHKDSHYCHVCFNIGVQAMRDSLESGKLNGEAP